VSADGEVYITSEWRDAAVLAARSSIPLRDLYRFRGAFRERRGLARCRPVERDSQRRNLAAERRLSPHGPWRRRDGDALFPLHVGRAWRAKKNRATGVVMLTFNAVLVTSRLRALLSRLGNFAAMGEQPSYCVRARHAFAFSGACQDWAEARLVFVHARRDGLQTGGVGFFSDFARESCPNVSRETFGDYPFEAS
jgi:hypothetical protein